MADGKLRSWDMKNSSGKCSQACSGPGGPGQTVIAAINGMAMGAGLDMAIMCDLRGAPTKRKMAASYIMMGLAPGRRAYFLPRLVGIARALELLLYRKSLQCKGGP